MRINWYRGGKYVIYFVMEIKFENINEELDYLKFLVKNLSEELHELRRYDVGRVYDDLHPQPESKEFWDKLHEEMKTFGLGSLKEQVAIAEMLRCEPYGLSEFDGKFVSALLGCLDYHDFRKDEEDVQVLKLWRFLRKIKDGDVTLRAQLGSETISEKVSLAKFITPRLRRDLDMLEYLEDTDLDNDVNVDMLIERLDDARSDFKICLDEKRVISFSLYYILNKFSETSNWSDTKKHCLIWDLLSMRRLVVPRKKEDLVSNEVNNVQNWIDKGAELCQEGFNRKRFEIIVDEAK